MPTSIKRLLALCSMLIPLACSWGQQKTIVEVKQNSGETVYTLTLGDFELIAQEDGTLRIEAEGLPYSTQCSGQASLPVWRQTVALPIGAKPQWESTMCEEEYLILKAPLQLVPQPEFKDGTPAVVPSCEEAEWRLLGILRDHSLAQISLCPFELRGDTLVIRRKMQRRLTGATPMAESKNDFLNSLSFSGRAPGYLVVSRPEFRPSLQPFVQWKREQGFDVSEMYVDTYQRDSIKSMLQALYDSTHTEGSFARFILLVGDINHIEPFPGRHNVSGLPSSLTDLYYAEFTGDVFPDALLGRIPVEDTLQLVQALSKIIDYERYRMADDSYLDRVLLMAGNESLNPAPVATNGQIDYLRRAFAHAMPTAEITHFLNPAFDTIPADWSLLRKDSVLASLEQGNGFVNYTGHGKPYCLQYPTISNNDFLSLPDDGKFAFVINNCCQGNDYVATSLGETLLRKRNGGAIGVIGATNQTLWNEDYYWAVGSKPLSTQPAYDSASCGAFDLMLHSHRETRLQQALTAGQILMAGNYAVTESGSQFADFYWEIYHLFGDPSLVPYQGRAEAINLVCHDSITMSTSSISLSGTPHAYVALAEQGALLGVTLLDSLGEGTILLNATPSDSLVTLTASKPYMKPWIDTMRVCDYPVAVSPTPQPSFVLYPNPAKDRITIDLGPQPIKASISIYDVHGRLVADLGNNFCSSIQYSLPHLRLGVYYVVVKTASSSIVERLLITH